MLHLFLEKGAWFRPKSLGYGAGLPFKWQGWVFLGAHIALILGLALATRANPLLSVGLVIIAALAPLPIYRARTEGGWRWRGPGRQ